jgi:hypothetical protein
MKTSECVFQKTNFALNNNFIFQNFYSKAKIKIWRRKKSGGEKLSITQSQPVHLI